jgi:hypothetical protein
MSSHSTGHRDNKTDNTDNTDSTKDSTRRDENATAHVNPRNTGETDTSVSPSPQTEKKMTTTQAIPRTDTFRQKIDAERAQRATEKLRALAAKVPKGLAWAHYDSEDIKKDLGTRHV